MGLSCPLFIPAPGSRRSDLELRPKRYLFGSFQKSKSLHPSGLRDFLIPDYNVGRAEAVFWGRTYYFRTWGGGSDSRRQGMLLDPETKGLRGGRSPSAQEASKEEASSRCQPTPSVALGRATVCGSHSQRTSAPHVSALCRGEEVNDTLSLLALYAFISCSGVTEETEDKLFMVLIPGPLTL